MKKHTMEDFIEYMRRTFMNKVAAIAFILSGAMCTALDNDATFLVLAIFISIPLFVTKKRLVY